MWRDWPVRNMPPSLGEIAAPERIPYDLPQAQAVRTCAALACHSGRGMESAVLLRVAADPSLPPITCPRSAAQQCGELMRLLEVLEEAHPEGSSRAAEAASSHQQPELALLGVAAEEHAALQQLVRCLVGETHAGLLEASQLLDVTRWGSSGHCFAWPDRLWHSNTQLLVATVQSEITTSPPPGGMAVLPSTCLLPPLPASLLLQAGRPAGRWPPPGRVPGSVGVHRARARDVCPPAGAGRGPAVQPRPAAPEGKQQGQAGPSLQQPCMTFTCFRVIQHLFDANISPCLGG